MTSKRGAKNLLSFNEGRQEKNVELISSAILECRERKISFDSITMFEGYIHKVTGIYRSNLRRNSTYAKMLQDYLDECSTGTLLTLNEARSLYTDNTAPSAILKGWLLELRLENSNLKERLKKEQVVREKQKVKLVDAVDSKNDDTVDSDYYNHFVDTAMALAAVLTRHQDILKLDLKTRSIIDDSARPSDRLVVGPTRLKHFTSWLEKNQEFLIKFISPDD